MGAMCPKCNEYLPIVRNLTVDQKPAKFARDVIGHELKCGHYFGTKDFLKIQETVNEIKIQYGERLMKLEEDYKNNLTKALGSMGVSEAKP